VDDLATALTKVQGFTATTPVAVTVDGYSGKQLTLTAPASFADCTLTQDGYGLMQLPGGKVIASIPGQQTTLQILDVGGKRLVISTDTTPTTPGTFTTDTRTILDSMNFQ
jgi:hypothetical protein